VFGPIGLGILLVIVGLGLFFVPGIGIFGIVLLIVGVLLIGASFAPGRRRSARPPA
jgi:hypothetical protein